MTENLPTEVDAVAPLGRLVEATAQGTAGRWWRLALVLSVLAAGGFLVSGVISWRVLDRLEKAERRDEAVAELVGAFADLATADTPAEQAAALEELAEAREKLDPGDPARREVDDKLDELETTTTTAAGGAGAAGELEEAAGPPPGSSSSTTTAAASSTTTTRSTTTSTPPPIAVVDPPPLGPLDLPPLEIRCLGLVCR